MLTAFYAGENALGLAACERLLGRRDTSSGFRDYVAGNESFYVNQLEATRRGKIGLSEQIRHAESCCFFAANPTVTELGGRIFANVRLVNYHQDNGLWYVPTAPDGIIRTRNVSLEMDPSSGRWVGERESMVAFPATWPQDVAVRGLEDLRWVTHDGRIWFTATSNQVPEHAGTPQVVLGRMNADLDAVEHLVAIRYYAATSAEKNWVPWSRNGSLYLIYSYDPFMVLHVDPTTGVAMPAFRSEPPWSAARFRGSTPPIRIPGSRSWLALTHEVALLPLPIGRVYVHRFVEFTDRFRLTRRSRPFFFDHRGIEYAAGLCPLGQKEILVTYGWEDREARWLTLDWHSALDALGEAEPLDPVATAAAPTGAGFECGNARRFSHCFRENTGGK